MVSHIPYGHVDQRSMLVPRTPPAAVLPRASGPARVLDAGEVEEVVVRRGPGAELAEVVAALEPWGGGRGRKRHTIPGDSLSGVVGPSPRITANNAAGIHRREFGIRS